MGHVPTALAVAHGVCISYVPSPCSCRARLRFRHGSPLPPQTPSLGPKSCLGNQFSIARAHSGAWLRYEIHASRQTDRPDHPPTRDRGESLGLWSCLVAAADPCCAPKRHRCSHSRTDFASHTKRQSGNVRRGRAEGRRCALEVPGLDPKVLPQSLQQQTAHSKRARAPRQTSADNSRIEIAGNLLNKLCRGSLISGKNPRAGDDPLQGPEASGQGPPQRFAPCNRPGGTKKCQEHVKPR